MINPLLFSTHLFLSAEVIYWNVYIMCLYWHNTEYLTLILSYCCTFVSLNLPFPFLFPVALSLLCKQMKKKKNLGTTVASSLATIIKAAVTLIAIIIMHCKCFAPNGLFFLVNIIVFSQLLFEDVL